MSDKELIEQLTKERDEAQAKCNALEQSLMRLGQTHSIIQAALEAKCTEMRDAIQFTVEASGDSDAGRLPEAIDRLEHALSADCGRGYVPMSELDELRLFVRSITLDLQKHRSLTDAQKDALFQRAYRFYCKYNCEQLDGKYES